MVYRFDLDAFISWANDQIDMRDDPLTRFTRKGYEMDNGNKTWKFRLRETSRGNNENIIFIRGDSVDTIRFEFGDSIRQFHAHKRNLRFTDRRLKVMTDGVTVCTAGTTKTSQRGPFPL